MKLTAILLLVSFLQVSAAGYGQKVTLSEKNASLQKIFREINQQTGYQFFYKDALLDKAGKVNIKVKDATVNQVLDQCLKNAALTYSITNNTITVEEIQKVPEGISIAEEKPFFTEVRGKVIDENGKPVPNVTILVKGKGILLKTDDKGEFALILSDLNVTLVFSSVAIEPIEVKLAGRTNIIVNVKTKITSDQEVVLGTVNTGYQLISKERSAGSFSKPNEIIIQDRASSTNLLQRLEGLVPGFAINLNTGATPNGTNRLGSTGEGNSNQFIIRGIGSIQGDRAPLYVVNGIILDDLNSLNANDVDDVTVLKDATAASIWGSRAANGVVVITTKKGARNQKLKVRYDAFYNMQGTPDYNYYPALTSAEFVKTARELFDPVTYPWSNVSQFTTATGSGGVAPHEVILYNQYRGLISSAQANAQLDSLSAINNSGQIGDYFYRPQSLMNQTISLSGGGNTHSFYGSLSYTDNQSSVPGEKNNQYNLNLRQDFNFSNNLKFYLITDLANNISSTKRSAQVDNRFLPYQLFTDANGNTTDLSYLSFITTDSVKNAFERQSGLNLKYNPLDEFNRGYTKSNGLVARITAGASIKLYKGLSFEGTYGYNRGSNNTKDFDDQNSFSQRSTLVQFTQPATTPGGNPTYYLPKIGGMYTTADALQKNWTVRNQLVYDRGFNNNTHQLNLLVGQEAQERSNNNVSNTVRGYNPLLLTYQLIDYNLLSTTGILNPVAASGSGNRSRFNTTTFSESESITRLTSYYAVGGYTYNSKYTVNGSWRMDKSNLFGIDKSAQRKPVWSTGVKWLISKEDFMQSVSWLNTLALRTTYGITGNAPSPGTATSYDVLRPNQSSFAPGPGLSIATYANKGLSWERTKNLNIGIDFAVLNRRVYGSLDYYIRKTTDLVGQVPTNLLAGANSIVGNFGDMDNKGVELSLSSVNFSSKDFTWSTTLNLAYNKNTITRLEQLSAINSLSKLVQQTKYREGYTALSIFAYDWAGLDNMGDPQIYLADGTTYKGASTNNLDLASAKYMGTFQPVWNGGLLNFFRYKNFNLSSSIIFNLGHKGRRDALQRFSGRLDPNRISFSGNYNGYPELQDGGYLDRSILNRWMKPGDEAFTDIPGYLNTNTGRRNTAYYIFGNNNVYDASYAKVRDITLSYGLPQTFIKRLKVDDIRFRVQVANIMLWKANKYDLDPEFQITDINFTTERRMPIGQGAVTVGVNVKF